MNERIFKKVKAYIEKYQMIVPGDTIAVGVSGGADSVCLLTMLYEIAKEIPIRLLVVHINHGIREEGKADAVYVETLCRERNLPFFLVQEDVRTYAQREKISEEEAGRKIRYTAFSRILQEYTQQPPEEGKIAAAKIAAAKVAVAHNANDRAETMLFHLFRGTGLSGVSGIKPFRNNIIRPILCLSREEIEEYLEEKQISFCIDHTNLEDTYTRNRIRNHILPFAEEQICHGAVSHMWETADMLLETEEYIKRQADKAYGECLYSKNAGGCGYLAAITLKADKLAEQESLIQYQILLRCLEELTIYRKDITSVHIKALKQLLEKQGSKRVNLPYGVEALKEYDKLIIYTKDQQDMPERETNEPLSVPIPGQLYVPELGDVEFRIFSAEEKELPWKKTQIIPEKSYTKWFDYDRITRSLVFRTREKGDYLTINEALSKKPLKEYMINEKIPKSQRENLFVLADGNHILWVPGYRISQYYKVTENTKNILQIRLRGGL